MLRLLCFFSVLAIPASFAYGEDAGPAETHIQHILSILREQPGEASPACLDALKEMHSTEEALQVATSHQKTSDIDLANDVLETDYQNVTQVCGVDATRVCNSQQSAKLAPLCGSLRHAN